MEDIPVYSRWLPTRKTTVPTSTYDRNFSEGTPRRTVVLQGLQVILDKLEGPVSFWVFCYVANPNVLENVPRKIAAALDFSHLH
jgi:hypothetical protein